MTRLPFDAGAAAGAPGSGEPEDDATLSVSQLANAIKRTLDGGMPSTLRVRGEISNLSNRNHWYFSLKDDTAVVSCVAWASAAAKFGFTPREGDAVIATGSVSHYEPQGRTQLYVRRLEPAGAGQLDARFRALCDELRRLGYFDEARKRPLPSFPRRVAVITSTAGAAVHDVVETARTRCPAVGLLLVDARVQGDGAAHSIAHAIRWVDARRAALGVDAIIVTRGGGSLEDLWAFNERAVADAALTCSLPIVAAIGHESDTTVIELVVDLRASTPTQAVVHLVPDRSDLARQVDHQASRLESLVRRRVERDRARFERLAGHAVFRRPRAPIDHVRQRVDGLAQRLDSAARLRLTSASGVLDALPVRLAAATRHLVAMRRTEFETLRHRLARAEKSRSDRARERLEGLSRRLDAVDPRLVLRRGFSYTIGEHGLVLGVGQVSDGDRIVTHVADGSFTSIVRDEEALDLFGDPR